MVARFHHVVSIGAAFTIMNRSHPETTLHCIYRVTAEVEPLKIYSPSSLRHHQPPRVCSHIHTARRNVPPFSCRTLFQNKSGTTDFDTVSDAEESKPEGRLTRQHRLGGRACRKLGGAGSSPKNTSTVETLRGFPSLTDITL